MYVRKQVHVHRQRSGQGIASSIRRSSPLYFVLAYSCGQRLMSCHAHATDLSADSFLGGPCQHNIQVVQTNSTRTCLIVPTLIYSQAKHNLANTVGHFFVTWSWPKARWRECGLRNCTYPYTGTNHEATTRHDIDYYYYTVQV